MSRLRVVMLGMLVGSGVVWAAQTGVISGFVRDKESGEFLNYVNVYLEGSAIGSPTNKQGYYALSRVPRGNYTLVVSMIGYQEERIEISVKAGQKLRRDFYLRYQPLGVEGVEITAERTRFEHEVDIGVKRMDPRQLRALPGFIEQDLFRSLAMLPGVVTISDYSSALYVRGGTADHNLVLLDDIPLYNPYHLLGFYSTFVLDGIKNAELYTGGYPARFGGGISSVLDVEIKEGNREKIEASGEVGLLTSKLMIEGPLPGLEGSWLVSGRRTYLDAITWSIDKMTPMIDVYLPYHFYDIQAKVNLEASERSQITFSGFSGDDILDFQRMAGFDRLDFRWGNRILGARWRYVIRPNLLSVLGLHATRYRVSTEIVGVEDDSWYPEEKYTYNLHNSIGELGARWSFSWFPDYKHSVMWGAEYKHIQILNSWEEIDEYWDFYETEEGMWGYILVKDTFKEEFRDRFHQTAAWIEDKWEPSVWWVIEAGLRGTWFSRGNYARFEPRLGIKYRLTTDLALKAGAGLYYQYLFIPMPRDEMALKIPVQFFQMWMPAGEDFPPLRSALLTAGTEYRFKNGCDLSFEAYYKDMANITEADWFFDDEPFSDTTSVITGEGYSWGGEFLFKYGSSWVSYFYSVTKYRFGDADWFYPVHDSRHNANISLTLPISETWSFTGSWVYSSGFPFTGLLGWYQVMNPDGTVSWKPISGARGEFRYPAYHRLDIGLVKRFPIFKRGNGEFYLQILNLYARKNILFYTYYINPYSRVMDRDAQYMLPFPVPSIGIRARF
ncbi:TonB-dependent receptor [candidate division WOR-3 bacterium]|nr:TonB-dependent receptor [candidate division WOR-3 bacterium]